MNIMEHSAILQPKNNKSGLSSFTKIELPAIYPMALSYLVAVSVLVVSLLMVKSNMTIKITSLSSAIVCVAAFVILSVLFALRHPRNLWQSIVRDATEFTGQFAMICLTGVIASYAIAAQTTGFVDSWLMLVDSSIYFDWSRWYFFVAKNTLFQQLGRGAYSSIFLSPIILILYFACTRRRIEAQKFIATYWLASVLTLLLFSFLPAAGPMAFLEPEKLTYVPFSALYQAELIPILRSGNEYQIDIGEMRGLVCAPSFHTCSAIIFIISAWRYYYLRWLFLFINLAMLLSTPVEGTHYMADMILGAVVAFVAHTIIQKTVIILGPRRFAPVHDKPNNLESDK